MSVELEHLSGPDDDQVPPEDPELQGRYEVRANGEILLMLDTFRGEYAAEWYTDLNLGGFLTLLSDLSDVGPVFEETQTFVMVSKDGGDITSRGEFDNIVEEHKIPEYTYLELQIGRDTIAWVDRNPQPTIITTFQDEDTEQFEAIYTETVDEGDATEGDIITAIELAQGQIKEDLHPNLWE